MAIMHFVIAKVQRTQQIERRTSVLLLRVFFCFLGKNKQFNFGHNDLTERTHFYKFIFFVKYRIRGVVVVAAMRKYYIYADISTEPFLFKAIDYSSLTCVIWIGNGYGAASGSQATHLF
jgi:hypothetical protein